MFSVKTFTDLNGVEYEIYNGQDLQLYYTEDIVTGNVTSYIVGLGLSKIKVDEKTFNAIDKYWSKLDTKKDTKNKFEFSRL